MADLGGRYQPISRKPVPQSPRSTLQDELSNHDLDGSPVELSSLDETSHPTVATRVSQDVFKEEAITHVAHDSNTNANADKLYADNVPFLVQSPSSFGRDEIAREKRLSEEPDAFARRTKRWQLKLWIPEMVSCVLSAMLLAGLVWLFKARDDKPLPEWPLGITVNTLTALISTLSRVAMIMPISEGISQLKWNWLTRGRPIMDIEIFNQASRGVWGSLRMIFTARGQLYSIIAAAVLLSSTATSTLTQSAIVFVPKDVNATEISSEHNAVSHAATCFPPYLSDDNYLGLDFEKVANEGFTEENSRIIGRLSHDFYFGSISAFMHGLTTYSGDRNVESLDRNTCSTGSCSWPRVRSLGVCAKVRNATDELVLSEDETGPLASLPMFPEAYITEAGEEDLLFTMPSLFRFNITTPGPLNTEGLFAWSGVNGGEIDFPPLLASAAFRYGQDDDVLNTTQAQVIFLYQNRAHSNNATTHFRAAELLLHFCVQTYEFSVEKGVSTTKLVGNSVKIANFTAPTIYEDDGTMYFTDEDGVDMGPAVWSTSDYSFSADVLHSDVLSSISGFSLYQGTSESGVDDEADFIMTDENEIEETIFRNIERIGNNSAMSISNVFRSYGDPVAGVPYITVTYIRIRWEWLSMLASQIFLTVVFLVIVIVHTATLGVDVVKSSDIAAIFALARAKEALDGNRHESTTAIEGLQRSVDKSVIGTLRERDGRWVVDVSHS